MEGNIEKVRQVAFFLDRDGVINPDHGYLHKIEDFEFLPGVFEACRMILQIGFKIVIVTNQAGIGRGYYTEAQFEELTAWMIGRFNQEGIEISDVQFCPHHPEAGLGKYKKDCSHRKPNPGMLLAAAKKLDISLSGSVLVGDKISDMLAGENAGVQSLFYVNNSESEGDKSEDFIRCKSLIEAVTLFSKHQ